jgi:D-amino-acid dehydrogenase
MSKTHVVVVGAGIVGLSVAYHLVRAQLAVTVLDRDPEGDKASFGNAGAIAVTEVVPASVPGVWWRLPGWMADPLGPISVRPAHLPKLIPWFIRFAASAQGREVERISRALAALNARVYDDLLPLLEEIGLSGELHRVGALSLYETEAGFRADEGEWKLKRSHGIVAEELSGSEARSLEPALGANICRAVFTPQWSHVSDPKQVVQRLREWLLSRGVSIRSAHVHNITPQVPPASMLELQFDGAGRLSADQLVIATGAWSGELARKLGDRVLLESERGYNATLADPGVVLQRELIFAERKFVATPLSCGLRIGGAAEFGGLHAPANFKRSDALLQLARRYLPDLRTASATRWAGHRSTTPDSLPVIGPSPHNPRVFYAFGHGHLGLTQAATTGRLIRDLILGERPGIDLSPYGIERFRAG